MKREQIKPHKDEYLIYNRKSTDDLENQQNSIQYQTIENLKFARGKNLPIANIDIKGFCTNGIISERHTGFKEDEDFTFSESGMVQFDIKRPKFKILVKALWNKEYKGVIFLCWDRASRNDNDSNILKKLIRMNVDIRFVQARYDSSSAGELHKDIDSMVAQHHSRNTSERVRNTTRKLRDEGYCTYRAPIGYLNTGDPRNKPFDPIRAPLVKQLFELCAEYGWSLADLTKWANDNGLVSRAVRRKRTLDEMLSDEEVVIDAVERPLTFNNTHKILTNLFYTGKVLGNDGVYIPSKSHKALISEDLFYKVQNQLNSKRVSTHYKDTLYRPYRGLIRCTEHLRVYSPYEQKGIDYYGLRCVKGCTNKNRNINAEEIESMVGKLMEGLSFTKEELIEIDNQVRSEVSTLEDKRQAETKAITQQKSKLREDQSYLRKNKLTLLKTGAYTPEDFLKEDSDITKKLALLSQQEQESDSTMEKVIQDTVILSELLEDAYLYYILAKPAEKQQIITTVFSELKLFGDTLDYKCRNGFRVLENRKTLLCDPTGNRTPISTVRGSRPNR
jgi:site-specific DNA recombinase